MDSEKIALRALIRHYWKKNYGVRETHRQICKVEGEGVLSLAMVENWFHRFNNGDLTLMDHQRSGRPPTVEEEAITLALEEQPGSSTRHLAALTGYPQTTIIEHLHSLGAVYKSQEEIPHQLTTQQRKQRLQICRQLLAENEQHPFLDRIITCDEKYVYFDNTSRGHQWLFPGEEPDGVPKKLVHSRKVMVIVFWSISGLIYGETIPEHSMINAQTYSDILKRTNEELHHNNNFRSIVRKGPLLLHDNARPHVATLTREKLEELGWDVIPHPPYSPDISPSDYHIFRSMAHFLKGKIFKDGKQIDEGMKEFFDSKNVDFYRDGIEQLVPRWKEVIARHGDYIHS